MEDDMETVRQRARLGLGLSIVAGVVVLGWFLTQGDAVRGAIAFLLFVGIGAWEYRRRMRSERMRRPPGMDSGRPDDRERK